MTTVIELPRVVRHELDRIERDLVREYRDRVPERTVRALVSEALSQMGAVRVPQFVPVLVLRSVRRQVNALEDSSG